MTDFDDGALAQDVEWRRSADECVQPAPLPHQGNASWHSRYSFTLDGAPWSNLTAFLGPDYRLSLTEEWDDEGIGRTTQVWCDGKMSEHDSTRLVAVSDALGAWNARC